MLTLCFCLSGYFAYHTVAGRYGLEARSDLLTRVTVLDFEAGALHKARNLLENEIALLSPQEPDRDLVAEIARDLLGYADPRERLIRVH